MLSWCKYFKTFTHYNSILLYKLNLKNVRSKEDLCFANKM